MEVYIIANIKNNTNVAKGYRLINIDEKLGVEIKDVTKYQLLYVLKNKTLKLENAKRNGQKIMGIYSSLDSLGNLMCGSTINEIYDLNNDRLVVLKQLVCNNEIIGAYVSNIKGEVRKLSAHDLKRLCITNKVVNASYINNVLEIKAKKQEIELPKKKDSYIDVISDEEARDRNVEWTINRFMKYMEQNGYSYELRDVRDKLIEDNSTTFIEEKYEKLNGKTSFTLSNIDENCKILHIPLGVTNLVNLWTYKKSNIQMDTIVVSRTVERTENIIVNLMQIAKTEAENLGIDTREFRWLTTRRLWFQEDYYTEDNYIDRKLYGFMYITVTGDCNLPITSREAYTLRIQNMYQNCTLPYVPKCKKYKLSVDLSNSFNLSKLNGINRAIDLNNIYNVVNSFNNFIGAERLIIGDTVKSIEKIFYTSNTDDCNNPIYYNPEIAFKSTSLKGIEKCFHYIKNYDEYDTIDLSEAVALREINASFMSSDIIDFILPDNLEYIKYGCGINMKQGNIIKLPADLNIFDFQSFGCNKHDNLDWSATGLVSISCHLGNYCSTSDNLIISDNFNMIHNGAFSQSYFKYIKQANNIKTLGERAFSSSWIELFDSRIMPKLSKLTYRVFEDCSRLTDVILGRNITEICNDTFKSCDKLSKIVISESLASIESNSFNQSGLKSGAIKVFTVNNCEAHKKLKNKKNIIMFTFDSFEEALDAYNGIEISNENQKNKFKMLMGSNPEYSELLEEPYLSNCQRLMTILKEFKSDEKQDFKLRADKLDLNGPDITDVFSQDIINSLNKVRNTVNTNIKDKKNYLRPRFINYCNFITSIGNNHNLVFRKENKDLLNISVIQLSKLCYIDERCMIFILRIKHVNNIVDNIAVILIDNKIVWSSLFRDDGISPIISSNKCILSDGFLDSPDNFNVRDNKIGNYISIGDNVEENMLNQCKLPNSSKYEAIWKYILNNNLILLGIDRVKALNKINKKDVSFQCTLTWLDLSTGKVITTGQSVKTLIEDTHSYYGSRVKIKLPRKFIVTGVYNMQDVINNPKSKNYNISELVDCMHDKEIEYHYRLLSSTTDDLDNYYNKPGAYDKSELKTEVLDILSQTFIEYNISSPSQLTKNAAIALLECGFCKTTDIRLATAFKRYGNPNLISIFGEQNVIMDFIVDNDKKDERPKNYHLYAVTNLTEDSNKVKIYKSFFSIDSLINKVKSLGYELKGEPLNGIIDTPINVDDFTFFSCRTRNHYYGQVYRLEIAVQHKTMEVFLVANNDDIDYYTIFRFKNFTDADEVLFDYKSKDENIQGCRNIDGGTSFYISDEFIDGLVALAESVRKKTIAGYSLTDSERYLDLYTIRELILGGLPNGYPVMMYKLDLLELLAKQPIKTS